MCGKVNFSEANVIIELGPGTGAFTKEILKKAKPNSKVFVLELNKDFYAILKEKFDDERMILVQ